MRAYIYKFELSIKYIYTTLYTHTVYHNLKTYKFMNA